VVSLLLYFIIASESDLPELDVRLVRRRHLEPDAVFAPAVLIGLGLRSCGKNAQCAAAGETNARTSSCECRADAPLDHRQHVVLPGSVTAFSGPIGF